MTEPHEGLRGVLDLDRVPHPLTWRITNLRPPARTIIRRRYPVRLHHAQRVPLTGPVILAANHVGVIDGPLLAIFSPRPVHALTKIEMFTGRLGPFLAKAGQIPLDRSHSDVRAIRTSLRVLDEGHVLGIFPEGARGDGELNRWHDGAAYLAMVSGAPIVPVIMIGTREPGGSSNSMPRRGTRVDIYYGEPIPVQRVPWPRRRDLVNALSEEFHERMRSDLAQALAETGRTLPGPLPVQDREAEAEEER